MKIYISYFYKVRFMNKNLLPVSTAKWDPDWFHNNPKNTVKLHIKNYGQYLDKNSVFNGLRCESLVFPEHLWESLLHVYAECNSDCKLKDVMNEDLWCPFMKCYERYLIGLNFISIIEYLEELANEYKHVYGIKNNVDVVLLVHEPSSCKCAERPVIQKWFKQHGIILEEWEKVNEEIK